MALPITQGHTRPTGDKTSQDENHDSGAQNSLYRNSVSLLLVC